MGSVDKGLQRFRGEPLIAHVLDRIGPQVGAIVVNANRNEARYRAFGHPVVADRSDDRPGPLAGIQAGLDACRTEYLVVVPCDAPFVPPDLVARLSRPLIDDGVDAAMAATASGVHPVFCLLRAALRASVGDHLRDGRRSVRDWIDSRGGRAVTFDDEHAFSNVNTLAELQAIEADDRTAMPVGRR